MECSHWLVTVRVEPEAVRFVGLLIVDDNIGVITIRVVVRFGTNK